MSIKKEHVSLAVIISLFVIVNLYLMPYVQDTKGAIKCTLHGLPLAPYSQHYGTCCDTQTDKEGIEITYCTDCSVDDHGIFFNCGPRYTILGELPLPPRQPNGNLTFSPTNTTNNTKPSSGLLNGRIPTTNTFNAPITSGNPSNPNNGTTTAMKATGGCIPGGSTCVPCDIGLARIGANCIPSGDWHPTNGLPPSSTLQQQQQQQPTTPPSTTTLPPSAGLLNKAPTDHTERCFAIVKGGGPVCNPSSTTTTTNQQTTPSTTTPSQHHHKGSNNNLQGGQELTPIPTTKKGKSPKTG
jgi:hypothetical protein